MSQIEPTAEAARSALPQFACGGCAYVASRRTAPDRCPMCGGSVWDFEPWRPFRHSMDAYEARLH
jgi:rubrerythrin